MQLFWIGTLTRNAVHALEVLSYKSSTSPSTPHSGEIRMSQKKHLMSLLDDARPRERISSNTLHFKRQIF